MRGFIAVVILAILAQQVPENSAKDVVCANTLITERDPTLLAAMGNSLLVSLSEALLFGSSNKVKQLKAYLVNSVNSNVKAEKDLSTTLVPLSIIDPYLHMKPSGCPFAEVINSTVRQDTTLNTSMLQAAIDGSMKQYQTAMINMSIYNAMKASGCGLPDNIVKPSVPQGNCFNDGFTYDFDALWDTYGTGIPLNARLMAKALYTSNNYKDRLFAAVVSYGLTPFRNSLNLGWSVVQGLEMLKLQTDSKIPNACCAVRLCRLNELRSNNLGESDRGILIQKKTLAPAPTYDNGCPAS